MADTAETIKEGAAALPVISGNLLTVIVLLLFLGVGLLVWRDEARADAQITVLREMAQHMADTDLDFKSMGVPIGSTKSKRLAVQAAAVAGGP